MNNSALTAEDIEKISREYLTPKEAAAAMGISRKNFYKRHAAMPFPVRRYGKNYRIPKKPFLEYLRTGQPQLEVRR